MKKTYIEPKNTVVRIKMMESIFAGSINDVNGAAGLGKGGNTDDSGIIEGCARETISAPDAWEEW